MLGPPCYSPDDGPVGRGADGSGVEMAVQRVPSEDQFLEEGSPYRGGDTGSRLWHYIWGRWTLSWPGKSCQPSSMCPYSSGLSGEEAICKDGFSYQAAEVDLVRGLRGTACCTTWTWHYVWPGGSGGPGGTSRRHGRCAQPHYWHYYSQVAAKDPQPGGESCDGSLQGHQEGEVRELIPVRGHDPRVRRRSADAGAAGN